MGSDGACAAHDAFAVFPPNSGGGPRLPAVQRPPVPCAGARSGSSECFRSQDHNHLFQVATPPMYRITPSAPSWVAPGHCVCLSRITPGPFCWSHGKAGTGPCGQSAGPPGPRRGASAAGRRDGARLRSVMGRNLGRRLRKRAQEARTHKGDQRRNRVPSGDSAGTQAASGGCFF